jgi:hypothetical protein
MEAVRFQIFLKVISDGNKHSGNVVKVYYFKALVIISRSISL